MAVAERRTVETAYRPLRPQEAFHRSPARVRGYGGAMGGGKSRALCEDAFDLALLCPGVPILVCRDAHTSIVGTTKKTMLEQTIPADVIRNRKASAGEDWVELFNGSVLHFIGLDDPVRWFSSEIGALYFDEAHEIVEDTVIKLASRLRHRMAPVGSFRGEPLPGKIALAFNPENPGHWLQQWFILGASQTPLGFVKSELCPTGSEMPIGDCEFIFANAYDNPHLPPGYIEFTLKSMPPPLRKRFLEGMWLHVSGSSFFDSEALDAYQREVAQVQPRWVGCTEGGPVGKAPAVGGPARIKPSRDGPLSVWRAPVRERWEDGKLLPAHRYVIGVDVSSGGSTDYSGIQVIDVERLEQVAEFQGKLDPDQLAVEAYRLGKVYNGALIAPEVTGGWGFSVVKELQRLKYPALYTRRIEDRLTSKWTDKLGWDTTAKSRAVMLDTLEKVLREREFRLNGLRTLNELYTFVRDDAGRPAAQPGCNDDLVVSLAIAVTVALQRPRTLRRPKKEVFTPRFAATGY